MAVYCISDSLLTDNCIKRISLNWTPRVGPCLSLLRSVDSLEDGHLSKKGRYVLVAKVSITDRVNCKHFELENGVMMTLKHCWIYH